MKAFDGTNYSVLSDSSTAKAIDNIAPNAPTTLVAVDTPADQGGSCAGVGSQVLAAPQAELEQ